MIICTYKAFFRMVCPSVLNLKKTARAIYKLIKMLCSLEVGYKYSMTVINATKAHLLIKLYTVNVCFLRYLPEKGMGMYLLRTRISRCHQEVQRSSFACCEPRGAACCEQDWMELQTFTPYPTFQMSLKISFYIIIVKTH